MTDTAEREHYKDTDAEGSNDTARRRGDRQASGGVLSCMITLAVAVLCARAGLVLGRLFAASRTPETIEHGPENPLLGLEIIEEAPPPTDLEKNWYYDLDPVTVNLNEPRFKHHVRASVTLEISSTVDPLQGRVFLEQKRILLTNQLTVHLASLAPQDLRGEGKIERIQSQIRDIFNKELFPPSRPHIKQVLLRHLAIE